MVQVEMRKKTVKNGNENYTEYQVATVSNWNSFHKNASEFEPMMNHYDKSKLQKLIDDIKIEKNQAVSVDLVIDKGYRDIRDFQLKNSKIVLPTFTNDMFSGGEDEDDFNVYAIFIRVMDQPQAKKK